MLGDIFAGTIPLRVQLFAIAGSLLLLLIVIRLIQREKLKEGYSIIWFLVGLALIVVSVVTRLLDSVARAVGINYSPTALFVILVGGLVLLALHFSVLVSKHDRQIRTLAQENAILQEQLRNQVDKQASP